VEELPRILSILSPAHHIASAMALDNLFEVAPPPLAQNMREALAQCLIFLHHLRKIYFLASSLGAPLAASQGPRSRTPNALVPHHVLDEMMAGVALAQEAASILGGRADHPLTASAGGVSRFLKEGHYGRLSEIADSCLSYVLRIREFVDGKIIGAGSTLNELMSLSIRPMASMTLESMQSEAALTDPTGTETVRFSPDKTLDTLELRSEPWTYLPFVHLKGKDWQGPMSEQTGGLYFVGPLARLNRNQPAETALAEAERQRLVDSIGPFPHFSVMAAYGSLVVELIEAAERMKELYTQERLTGPQIRTIPSRSGHTGCAAFEAPEGFIYHRYGVDERGIVEDLTVLDASAENNALRCLLTQSIVEDAVARNKPWDTTKKIIELSLLPF
jgi:F420-non-reducing hydrogenase large subunit